MQRMRRVPNLCRRQKHQPSYKVETIMCNHLKKRTSPYIKKEDRLVFYFWSPELDCPYCNSLNLFDCNSLRYNNSEDQ